VAGVGDDVVEVDDDGDDFDTVGEVDDLNAADTGDDLGAVDDGVAARVGEL
jgi:hypothetical protein